MSGELTQWLIERHYLGQGCGDPSSPSACGNCFGGRPVPEEIAKAAEEFLAAAIAAERTRWAEKFAANTHQAQAGLERAIAEAQRMGADAVAPPPAEPSEHHDFELGGEG